MELSNDEKMIGAITGGTLAVTALATAIALLSNNWNREAVDAVQIREEIAFDQLVHDLHEAHGDHGGEHAEAGHESDGHASDGHESDHAGGH